MFSDSKNYIYNRIPSPRYKKKPTVTNHFFLLPTSLQAARKSVSISRVQQRTFIDGLVNSKSSVSALQLKYQDPAKAHLHGADDPTYLKGGSTDNMVAGVGGVFFFFTCGSILNGMWNMAHGTNKLN